MYEKRGSDWGVGGLVLAALRSSPDPLTVRQIAEATGRSTYGVRNNLDMLCLRGDVVRLGRGGPHTPWRYTLGPSRGVSSAQIMRAIFALEELVASGEDRARDPLLILGELAKEVAELRQGLYAPVDNPRPLRDFLGVLPARYMGKGR